MGRHREQGLALQSAVGGDPPTPSRSPVVAVCVVCAPVQILTAVSFFRARAACCRYLGQILESEEGLAAVRKGVELIRAKLQLVVSRGLNGGVACV